MRYAAMIILASTATTSNAALTCTSATSIGLGNAFTSNLGFNYDLHEYISLGLRSTTTGEWIPTSHWNLERTVKPIVTAPGDAVSCGDTCRVILRDQKDDGHGYNTIKNTTEYNYDLYRAKGSYHMARGWTGFYASVRISSALPHDTYELQLRATGNTRYYTLTGFDTGVKEDARWGLSSAYALSSVGAGETTSTVTLPAPDKASGTLTRGTVVNGGNMSILLNSITNPATVSITAGRTIPVRMVASVSATPGETRYTYTATLNCP